MITTDCETPDVENTFDYPFSSSIFFADAVVIFDDVFVPIEKVFMDGEWRFSGDMAYAFGNSHRLFADSYKYVELEILVGAAALIAEYNGLEKIPHVQDKLAWLTMYCEAVEALAEQACVKCIKEPGSDLVYPNPMYSNVTKYFYADNYHQAIKHVLDIAGGLVATIPSSKDFLNPETRPLLEKYLGGKAGIPTEHRLRAFRLIRDLSSGWHGTLTIHGEGSLATQRMSVLALADLDRYKAAARRVARIKGDKEHPLFRDLPEFPLNV
jgi:4-hydroxybutyryl-CoA dehydratase/vinylacetyl-CoA-Delta-isomerase